MVLDMEKGYTLMKEKLFQTPPDLGSTGKGRGKTSPGMVFTGQLVFSPSEPLKKRHLLNHRRFPRLSIAGKAAWDRGEHAGLRPLLHEPFPGGRRSALTGFRNRGPIKRTKREY
jgi:hypothetical protein